MPTNQECICSCEIDTVVNREKMLHKGFEIVRLDVWDLQTANYRRQYSEAEEKAMHNMP